jgi:hypothetical protein
MIYIPKQINIKLIEMILKQYISARSVERLLNYIGLSKKDPTNYIIFLYTKLRICVKNEQKET